MKKILLFSFITLSLLSCSSDDGASVVNETSDFTNALPLNNGNYWTYDVVSATTTRDSLYIFGDEAIGSHTYKKFKNKNDIATGFYTSSLNNNHLRKDNGKLLLTGSLNVPQGQTLPIGLDLNVVDFIIFKEYATSGELLSEKTGTFNQTVNGIPLTVEYKLKSIGGENIGNFTPPSPNNTTYTDVKSTKIVVNLKITTIQTIAGFPVTITVLQPQDVIVSTQYLSKNIGVVYTKTDTSYVIDTNIASSIGVPATFNQTQKEFLDTYNVN
jgi:hypothetical protein